MQKVLYMLEEFLVLPTCPYSNASVNRAGTPNWSSKEILILLALGMVHVWVAQKLLKCYILRVFLMSNFINIQGD